MDRGTAFELALWTGASLTLALGAYLVASAVGAPAPGQAPVLPPSPTLGTNNPEVFSVVGPYGIGPEASATGTTTGATA